MTFFSFEQPGDGDVNWGSRINSNFAAIVASQLDAIAGLSATKGNVLVGNGTTWVALGVGSNGHVLTADSGETAGVKWAAGGGGGGVTVPLVLTLDDATNNDVSDVLRLDHTTTGSPSNGLGAGIVFRLEDSASATNDAGRLAVLWSDVTDASEDADFSVRLMRAGSMTEALKIQGSTGYVTVGEWQATAIGVAFGGTGATTAANARTNLGLAIGTDVQAYDPQLSDFAALTPTKGRLAVADGTNWQALSVGTDSHVLTADSAQSLGVKWAAAASGGLSGITNSTTGQLAWSTGSGAITQILGPTDQNLTIAAASAGTTSTGRDVTLASGPGGSTSGMSGAIVIQPGSVTSGAGGNIAISGRNALGSNNVGSSISISAGASVGSGTGGSIVGTAGASGSNGAGGAVTWTAGDSQNAAGGVSSLIGGGGTANNKPGGIARVVGGAGHGLSSGGAAQLTGGSSDTGGAAQVTGGAGGSILFGAGGPAQVIGGAGGIGPGGAASVSGGAAGAGTTNKAGGALTLSTGPGTGLSSADVLVTTGFALASGTTMQTAYDRLRVTSKTFACSTTSGTSNVFCVLSNAVSDSGIGATINFTIEVIDGSSHCSTIRGAMYVSASNRTGTVTANCSTFNSSNGSVSDTTTFTALTTTTTATVSGTNVQCKVTPSWSAGTPTVVRITYSVLADGQTTITPQ